MRPTLLLLAALILLAPAAGGVALYGSFMPPGLGAAQCSTGIEPKRGWEKPRCSKLADALEESLTGAFFGLLLVAIPALILAFTRFRMFGLALAMFGAMAGASIMGWLYWGIASEPA